MLVPGSNYHPPTLPDIAQPLSDEEIKQTIQMKQCMTAMEHALLFNQMHNSTQRDTTSLRTPYPVWGKMSPAQATEWLRQHFTAKIKKEGCLAFTVHRIQ